MGENPRTTLCEPGSSTLVSEPTVCLPLCSLPGLLIGAEIDDESDDRKGAWIVGEVGRGVISVEGSTDGIASEIVGESGPIRCLS